MRSRDLTNETFGRLRVLARTANATCGHKQYDCVCTCGNMVIVRSSGLLTGNTRSCGCLQTEARSLTGRRNVLRQGNSNRNSVVHQYRKNARLRNLSCTLTEGDFDRLLAGDCHYCGCEPARVRRTGPTAFAFNGIDRVDNTQGYSPENCVSCCLICNRAKGVMSAPEFLAWVNRVVRWQNLCSST
jgi:hypothetical protein